MSFGHPYFNRDIGMQNYADCMNSALQQQMLQNAFGQAQLRPGAVIRYDESGCVSACVSGSSVGSSTPPATSGYIAPSLTTSKGKSMFKEVTTDIKNFILEHRGVIYFIVAALVLDNLFFKGAFKARLQAMADRVVTKVEEKIQ